MEGLQSRATCTHNRCESCTSSLKHGCADGSFASADLSSLSATMFEHTEGGPTGAHAQVYMTRGVLHKTEEEENEQINVVEAQYWMSSSD
eukprot:5370764-Heterocapsa_arctica.AAC.1